MRRPDAAASALDGLLLLLGGSRPDWDRAMRAELATLEASGERARFVVGCGWALLSAPAVRRSGSALLAGAVASVVLAAAFVGWALVRFPGVVTGTGSWVALVMLLGVLLGYVGAAAVVRARLGAVDARAARASLGTGLAGGAVIAGCSLAVGISASIGLSATVGGILLVVVPVATVVLGLVAGSRGRSVAPTAILTSGLVAGLAVFLVWVGETVSTSGRPYDSGLLRDFASSGRTDLATYAVNDALGAALVLLVLVPMLTTVLAGVTAMLAGSRRRR